jgi:hypothetical protein
MDTQFTPIDHSTRLVLGDWVRGMSDGRVRYYRLGMWIEKMQKWGLFEDGLDDIRHGNVVFAYSTKDMANKGFERAIDRLSMRYATATVYWLPSKSERPVEVPVGIDPISGRKVI